MSKDKYLANKKRKKKKKIVGKKSQNVTLKMNQYLTTKKKIK